MEKAAMQTLHVFYLVGDKKLLMGSEKHNRYGFLKDQCDG